MRNSYLDNSVVTLHLIIRSERMNCTELGPCQWDHAASAIELHSTTSERNHAVNQAQILRSQVVDVPQHLCLGMVLVENRVG